MDTNPEIKFLHYRYSDDRGVYARGGLTIAFREVRPGVIQHASAKCHLNDNFRKDLGRIKAAARLDSKQARLFDGTEGLLLEGIDHDLHNYNVMASITGGMTLARKFNGKRKVRTEAAVNADTNEA